MNNNNHQAIHSNPKRASKYWTRVSRVLRSKNASPRVSGSFYRVAVHAVLLYTLGSWKITQMRLKLLESFHLMATWQMVSFNKPRREPDDSWAYPAMDDVLDEVGYQTFQHCIEVRWQTTLPTILWITPYSWPMRELRGIMDPCLANFCGRNILIWMWGTFFPSWDKLYTKWRGCYWR